MVFPGTDGAEAVAAGNPFVSSALAEISIHEERLQHSGERRQDSQWLLQASLTVCRDHACATRQTDGAKQLSHHFFTGIPE